MVLLHDVERRQLHIEAEGTVSALGHDIEVDGIGLDVLVENLYLLTVDGGIFGFGTAVCLDTDDRAQREENRAVQELVSLPFDEQRYGEVYGFYPRKIEVGILGTGRDVYLAVLLDKVAVFVHDIVAPVDAQTGDESPVVGMDRGTDGDEIPKYFERSREIERNAVGFVEESQAVAHAVAEAETHARPVRVETFAPFFLFPRNEIRERERYLLGEFP